MKLADLNKDWRQNITFSYKLGLINYHCKVKYLPFCKGSRDDYGTKNLTEIYTPVFHFEFETLNTEETIYQSHWVMPYSLVWFLINYPDSSLDILIRFAAKENGFIESVSAVDKKLQRGTQLLIF